jgi:hypothetical protein
MCWIAIGLGDFDQVIPVELRSKQTSLSDISADLFGANRHNAGLAEKERDCSSPPLNYLS